jgi:hypothetical protein
MLTINYNASAVEFKLKVLVDFVSVDFTQTATRLEVPCELTQGFHLLEIYLVEYNADTQIEFTSAQLNGQDFRHTIYAMFDNNTHSQTTKLSEHTRAVTLPFMNPLIWWITACLERIPNKLFAGQLYETMSVYYPQSIQLNHKYPQEIRDYFFYNRDFHAHLKYSVQDTYFKHEVPYLLLGDLVKYDETAMVQELFNNLDFLKQQLKEYYGQRGSGKPLGQGTQFVSLFDNINSDSDSYNPKLDFMLDPLQFPKMLEFFENLPVQKVFHSMLGLLGPGQVILPHVDKYTGHETFMESYGGCSQIYIPLNFKPGNYFKMTNVGIVPTDQGAVLMNNHDLTHALVNDSDEYRFAILIVGTKLPNA